MPVIGFLSTSSWNTDHARRIPPFLQGLKEAGYTEGRNVAIEYRGAESQLDRLPALAADLVRRNVSLIAAIGSPVAALGAKAATTTIPIVFVNAADPVRIGLVASLNRPGGNVTGATQASSELGAKRLGLLRELVPAASSFAILVNPTRPDADTQSTQLQEAAKALGLSLQILKASSEREFDAAFQSLAQMRVGALVVAPDALFTDRRDRIVALARRYSVPAIYEFRDYVEAGGLISYGVPISEVARQAGILAGRILKDEKPADLPVMQPTKFDLVINLKAAKALGLTIPPGVMAIADEVIE
jgi:putative ABC transport system substrate-binding protein